MKVKNYHSDVKIQEVIKKRMKKIVAILMAMLMVMSVTVVLAGGAVATKPAQSEKTPVIIVFKDKSDPNLIKQHGGEMKCAYHIIPGMAASLSLNAIDALSKNPKIAYIVEDKEVFPVESPTLPWGVDRIDADVAHEYNSGTGVKVAIIDTGIDYSHPDLDDNFNSELLGYDFADNDNNPMDYDGHGTHCAGIVAAEDNEIGVIGVAPDADLYALKVFTDAGSGSYSDVVSALEWSIDNGMDVISMSIGSKGDPGIEPWIDAAYGAGIILIGSAGNEGNPAGRGDNVIYPAKYKNVTAVAATDISDERARWSSTGPDVELSAPGVSIYSTYLDNRYAYMSGTSMACPHVAGTAALVIASGITDSNGDGMINDEVRARLQKTAEDLGAAGFDTKYGYGLVDAEKAALPTGNQPPVADAGLDQTVIDADGDDKEAVTLDGSGSYDPDGTSLSYMWTEEGNQLSTGVSFTHDFAVGTHTVTLTVTDNDGATDSDEVIITVEPGGSGNTMHVHSIEMSTGSKSAGRNTFVWAVATVTIVDANNDPVEGATVSGYWSDATTDSDSGITDASGQVSLKSDSVKNAGGTFIFCVNEVSKEGWVWVDAQPVCGSITVQA